MLAKVENLDKERATYATLQERHRKNKPEFKHTQFDQTTKQGDHDRALNRRNFQTVKVDKHAQQIECY